jgi:hypothetical protein
MLILQGPSVMAASSPAQMHSYLQQSKEQAILVVRQTSEVF